MFSLCIVYLPSPISSPLVAHTFCLHKGSCTPLPLLDQDLSVGHDDDLGFFSPVANSPLLLLLLLPDLLETHQLSPYVLKQQHIISTNKY